MQVQYPIWHIYEIDENASVLSGMRTLEEWKVKLAIDDSPAAAEMVDIEFESAIASAKSTGWRGNTHRPPLVFVLPNRVDFQFGFVVNARIDSPKLQLPLTCCLM